MLMLKKLLSIFKKIVILDSFDSEYKWILDYGITSESSYKMVKDYFMNQNKA
jgi:hypothetical protein